jgi:IclR family mhp operon transcriptional activator
MVRKRDRYDRVAEAAAPVLDRLCQKISWASDLMVPAGDHMEIRETSRMQSPFLFAPDRIGTPINWLLSGVGRAYLAFCPEEERQHILKLVRKSTNRGNWLGHDAKRLNEVLAETRKRGYGTRDQAFVGGSYGISIPDGLEAIAVPLLGRKQVHGAINIIWTKPAHTIDEMVGRYLADLQTAAVEIVDSLMKRPTIRAQPQSREGDQRRGRR